MCFSNDSFISVSFLYINNCGISHISSSRAVKLLSQYLYGLMKPSNKSAPEAVIEAHNSAICCELLKTVENSCRNVCPSAKVFSI